MYKIAFAVLYLLLLNVSCEKESSADKLIGKWLLQEMDNRDFGKYSTIKAYELTISVDQYQLGLDVNACVGSYELTGDNQIIFDPAVICTEACCDSDSAKAYASQVARSTNFSFKGGKLVLTNDKNEELIFKKAD